MRHVITEVKPWHGAPQRERARTLVCAEGVFYQIAQISAEGIAPTTSLYIIFQPRAEGAEAQRLFTDVIHGRDLKRGRKQLDAEILRWAKLADGLKL